MVRKRAQAQANRSPILEQVSNKKTDTNLQARNFIYGKVKSGDRNFHKLKSHACRACRSLPVLNLNGIELNTLVYQGAKKLSMADTK